MTNAEKSARYRAKDVDAYRERKRTLAKTDKHRETRRLYMQKWRAANRDQYNAWARENQKKNRHKYVENAWAGHLRREYGITPAEYEAMSAKQGGRCAICGSDKPGGRGKRFHTDHCHKTGRVRGLLCSMCNGRVGTLEAWYARFRATIDAYLAE